MSVIPANGYISNAVRTEADVKQALEDGFDALRQVPGAGRAELTSTISSGAITPAGAGGVVVVDTEAAAAVDDLTNIVTTNYPDGSFLLLRNSNTARSVIARHLSGGAGQMNLLTPSYTLDDTRKWLMLQRRSADWHEIFRAPYPVIPVANPIINGSMEVWQRGTAFPAIANNTYGPDRWFWSAAGTVVATANRSTSVPTVAQAGVLFNYSLEIDITTADAALAVGDYALVSQRLEGYNWRHFAQRQFTLSFWVYSSKTGTHCVSFRNNGVDRSYVAEYSIAVANTWEYKTVTVAPSPSAGGWDYTTGIGIELAFALASGTTFQTTANAWQTGNFLATSNQVNVLDNAVNVFRVTGVKMELGATATPLDFVSFDEELARCQRYYQKSFPYATAPAQNAGIAGSLFASSTVGSSTTIFLPVYTLPVEMRVTPTITYFNPSAANAQARNLSLVADCTGTSTNTGATGSFLAQATTPASSVISHLFSVHWTASAEL